MPQTVKFQDKTYNFPDDASKEQMLMFLKGQVLTQNKEIPETPGMVTDEDDRVLSKANAQSFGDGFKGAVAYTFENEGGFANDPDDSMTNLGISSAAHPEEDIRNMDEKRATEIYLERYWDKPRLGKITDKRVAIKIFDHGVLNGETSNVLRIQRMLGVKATGVINDVTVKAIDKIGSEKFLKTYQTELVKFYKGVVKRNPKKRKFLETWLRRTAKLPPVVEVKEPEPEPEAKLTPTKGGLFEDEDGNLIVIDDKGNRREV